MFITPREAIATAVLLLGVGAIAFLPLAADSEQEQKLRYLRRMLLLWVQNLIIAFTVLLPIGYAVASHKHRKVIRVSCNARKRRLHLCAHSIHFVEVRCATYCTPLFEAPQMQSPLRIKVSKSANELFKTLAVAKDDPQYEGDNPDDHDLFRDDKATTNTPYSFVVTLQDIWNSAVGDAL